MLASDEEADREVRTLSIWPIQRTQPLDHNANTVLLRYHRGQSLDQLSWSDKIHDLVAQMSLRLATAQSPEGLPTLREVKKSRFQELERRLHLYDDAQMWHWDIFYRLREQTMGLPGGDNLLHGDMNPGNMLLTDAGDIMPIDPKGICGDQHYDWASWVVASTPQGWRSRMQQYTHSLHKADAEVDEQRLEKWCEYLVLDGWVAAGYRHTPNLEVWEQELRLIHTQGRS
jgi:streptomycin 6-kinase